jgi:hypothetical protein
MPGLTNHCLRKTLSKIQTTRSIPVVIEITYTIKHHKGFIRALHMYGSWDFSGLEVEPINNIQNFFFPYIWGVVVCDILNVPPSLRDGETHKGDVWKYPQILGIFGKWGTRGRHIYNIKNIKNKILKIKIITII